MESLRSVRQSAYHIPIVLQTRLAWIKSVLTRVPVLVVRKQSAEYSIIIQYAAADQDLQEIHLLDAIPSQVSCLTHK